MRDYRPITATEFVAESIEMKMRWLARRLRWTDNTEEIEQWAKVVATLENLRQRLKGDCKRSTVRNSHRQRAWPRKSENYTISAPYTMDCNRCEFGSDMRVKQRTEGEVRSVSMEAEMVESKQDKNEGSDKSYTNDVKKDQIWDVESMSMKAVVEKSIQVQIKKDNWIDVQVLEKNVFSFLYQGEKMFLYCIQKPRCVQF